MYDFLECVREDANLSKREVILSVACGVLAGVVVGFLVGTKANRPPKPPKRVIIKEVSKEPESFRPIGREDYE